MTGYLYREFANLDDLRSAKEFADANGYLLMYDEAKRWMVVLAEGHAAIKTYMRERS